MGHIFRSCVLARAFVEAGHRVKFYINGHKAAIELLVQHHLPFEIVPLSDATQDWESRAIPGDRINVWIYDRHSTDIRSAARVKAAGIPLATFDDRGSGAAIADLHVASLSFEPQEVLGGRRVVRGVEYLILDPAIAAHRRGRRSAEKLVVTLGGADTHGVTTKVMRLLSRYGRTATVIVGPAFMHDDDLARVDAGDFTIKRNVPSLITELARHDVAVTAGGMTPFEANASGLPCIVIATEDFEIPVGAELERLGGAVFAGHHRNLDESVFARSLPVEAMSNAALRRIPIDGTRRVVEAVLAI